MLKLYRNLLDITITNGKAQIEDFTDFIRQHNEPDPGQITAPKEYWNLLLEMLCLFVTLTKTLVGISLLFALLVVFFPLNFCLTQLQLFLYRAETMPATYVFDDKPLLEEMPVKKARVQK